MARLTIVAPGSRGHVDPVISVGVALHKHGHQVTVLADRCYGYLAHRAGLRFLPLAGSVVAMTADTPPNRAVRVRRVRHYLAQVNANLEELLSGSELVLTGELGLGGCAWAEVMGVPSVGMHAAPTFFRMSQIGPVYDPHGRTAERIYLSGVAELYQRLGANGGLAQDLLTRQQQNGWPLCCGFSRHVVQVVNAVPPHIRLTGYWWPYRAPESTFVPADGSLLLTLGSMRPANAARLLARIAEAADRAGVPLLVQEGVSTQLPAGTQTVSADVDYHALLSRVRAVLHYAGPGITAACLRAGTPSIPLPFTSPDQIFWAELLRSRGLAPEQPMSLTDFDVSSLTEAIVQVLSSPDFASRTRALSAELAAEDGVGEACRMIGAILAN